MKCANRSEPANYSGYFPVQTVFFEPIRLPSGPLGSKRWSTCGPAEWEAVVSSPDESRRRRGVPAPSSEGARRRMKAAAPRDTAAELALRAALDRLGVAYLVDQALLPGLRLRADIVIPDERVAVFVDGCFWHGCPMHGTWPKENAGFWREKIETNRRRDAATSRRLEAAGWRVVRVWEHENPYEAAAQIASILEGDAD